MLTRIVVPVYVLRSRAIYSLNFGLHLAIPLALRSMIPAQDGSLISDMHATYNAPWKTCKVMTSGYVLAHLESQPTSPIS